MQTSQAPTVLYAPQCINKLLNIILFFISDQIFLNAALTVMFHIFVASSAPSVLLACVNVCSMMYALLLYLDELNAFLVFFLMLCY